MICSGGLKLYDSPFYLIYWFGAIFPARGATPLEKGDLKVKLFIERHL